MKNDVYLSLGSNVGDREKNLSQAVEMIAWLPKTQLVKVSNLYETDPVGYSDQEKFINIAALIRTTLEPLKLLGEFQKIEAVLKRTREIRWGPRTIDIDILLYENFRMESGDLIIPHPRMLERAFVLVPLKDIFLNDELFGNKIEDLISVCDDSKTVKLYKFL